MVALAEESGGERAVGAVVGTAGQITDGGGGNGGSVRG